MAIKSSRKKAKASSSSASAAAAAGPIPSNVGASGSGIVRPRRKGTTTTTPAATTRGGAGRRKKQQQQPLVDIDDEDGDDLRDEEEEEEEMEDRKPILSRTKSSRDRLSTLSPELHALILNHLSPTHDPDIKSLFHYALVSKQILPHVRQQLYRVLTIDSRTTAHALHRTLHGTETSKAVKHITADVSSMAKTSSQWSGSSSPPPSRVPVPASADFPAPPPSRPLGPSPDLTGWFLFHSMHSLCGIIGSCRSILSISLHVPSDGSAWTHSVCTALADLKLLHTLNKDLVQSSSTKRGAGTRDSMDVGWKPNKTVAMWSVSQFLKPLATLKNLHTLRLCGISSDSSTVPPVSVHSCRLVEVVLIEVNVTNTDLLQLLGNASTIKKFTLWRSSLLSKRGLTHVLKRCTNLVELRIGGSWFGAKDEDDTNFPIDSSIPFLLNLRLLHVSGSLVSPLVLLSPNTNLTHLLVVHAPAWTPQATHAALAKMRSDPPPVAKLTLPEMSWNTPNAHGGGGGGGHHGHGTGGEGWSETWRFTVRATAEAKCVVLEDGKKTQDEASDSGSD